jgi:membrane protein implicated in regulation of membrane protease activity
VSFVDGIEFWYWWIFAILLLVVEAFLPGQIFLWMGLSAGVVGLVLLIFADLDWEFQFLLFAVLSVVSIAVWRVYHRAHPTETDKPTLNRRGEQYVGRQYTLEEPIVNRKGKLHVDDTVWRIQGDDMPAGTTVIVVGADGVLLQVEKA